MTTPMRWALVGASDIAATRLIPALRAAGDHVTVVQSGSAGWGQEYASRHGISEWTTDLAAAVGRDDIDAVYVSSKNELHRAQVEAAAAAGKHVLAEKPLALTLDDARAMVAACEAAGVVIATNHHLPASPTHRAMKRLVAEGAIGEVRAVHFNHAVGLPDRLRGWRVDDPVSGGVVLDVFVHDMAAIGAILGGQARSVAAQARPSHEVAPDSVMTAVLWDGDVIAQTHDAYDNYHLPTHVQILGTKGAIHAEHCNTQDPVGEVFVVRDGVPTPIDLGPLDDLYLTTVRTFDAAVREGTPVLVSGLDGVRSLAAALAAQQAVRTGATTEVARI